MESLVEMIDKEICNRSLLKHPFYQMWTNGELNMDHLQGYSKEYSSLVKSVPKMVSNIAKLALNEQGRRIIQVNQKEESEHIELWKNFVLRLGVTNEVFNKYRGDGRTKKAISKLKDLTAVSFEEGVSTMYAYEMELPKISRSKIDGLQKHYRIADNDALLYFRIHEEVDVRHAQVWRDFITEIPTQREKPALSAAVKSLEAQNELLDSVYNKYVV